MARRALLSLEQIYNNLGATDPAIAAPLVPLPNMERLLHRATNAMADGTTATVWTLHEAGLTQERIAANMGLSRSTVQRCLCRARSCIVSHVTKECMALFLFEEHCHAKPQGRTLMPPLPSNLARARETLEGWGLETHVYQDEPETCYVDGKQKQWKLTFGQTIKWAVTGTAPRR